MPSGRRSKHYTLNTKQVMTPNIQIFENAEFGKVRTMTSAEGEALFCGKDVAEALGYKNPKNAVAMHVDGEDKTTALIQVPGSNYKSNAIFINESGLYALILSSKLDSARRLRNVELMSLIRSMHLWGGIRLTECYAGPQYRYIHVA